MKLLKTISLTALMALAASACTSMMTTNGSAPVDSMSPMTSSSQVTPTTVRPTGTTIPGNGSTTMGGTISNDLGKSMDDTDTARVNQTLETQKTGQTSTWTNSTSNISYTLTPTRTFSSPTGEPCRDFTVSALINGKTQQIYGTACRDSKAQWHVISS